MRAFTWLRSAAIAALLAPYATALGQQTGISEILQGSESMPSVLKPQDLPQGYRAARIQLAASGGLTEYMSSMMPMMFMGSQRGSGSPPTDLFRLMDLVWTKGDVVELYGNRYLVTYKIDTVLFDLMARDGRDDAEPLNANLRLNLLRTDSVASISPDPQFTKDRMLAALDIGSIKSPFAQADEAAKKAATLSNVKQASLALIMYSSDYDDVLPYVQSTKAVHYVTYPYAKTLDIWKTLNPAGGEFRFNMALAGVNQTAIENPAETVLFFESKEWPDGRRAVAYADTHAKMVTREEWAALSKTLALKLPKSGKPLPADYGVNWTPPPLK